MTALMMEAASISETSVDLYQTAQRNIPEDSHLYARSRENLTSQLQLFCLYSVPTCFIHKAVCRE
jgi:hypothetical protein